MIHYLFYKFYRAAEKSSVNDIPVFAASTWLAGCLSINIFLFEMFLAKLNVWRSFIGSRERIVIVMIVAISFSAFYFFHNKRYKKIVDRYSKESESLRKRGNLLAWAYVILTVLMIYAVGLFRPGYWPKM